jgi:polyphosphate glucokinase
MENEILGIDIGGTGIKGAIIDVQTGKLLSDRVKIPTPAPASPSSVVEVVGELLDRLKYKNDIVGIGFPAVVSHEICETASNISKDWIGVNLIEYFSHHLDKQVTVINDADAAGVAELQFGDIETKNSTVLLLTLGTGFGSAVFIDGKLLPNTELGFLKYKDSIVEKYASNKVREDKDLSYKEWGGRVSNVLNHVQHLFTADHIILGGGISKKFDKYKEYLEEVPCKVTPATLLNNAGMIGAASYAADHLS